MRLRQVEHALEFAAAPDPAGLREALRRHAVLAASSATRYVEETVRRLRPFARRRLSTRRPFLVAMRTRNPACACGACVWLKRDTHCRDPCSE